MRIQKVEELELDKITIIAKVSLSDKRVQTVKVNGVKATEKMVNLTDASHMLYCQRKYKHDIGVVGVTYDESNILLAYDEEHLNSLLELIKHNYVEDLTKRIVSLEDTLDEFTSVEWNTQVR